jgi:iron complex outermembrane receptor protein
MSGRRRRASLLAVMLGAGLLVGAAQAQELERVEITGSALPRLAAEGSLPVQVIRRDAIDRSGATSVVDLVQRLPSMQNFRNEAESVGGGASGFSGASIHNLGESRTLVLLNGRRLASFGGQTLTGAMAGVDLNIIPLASVERVEILSDGASAIYGADAVAGVINVITRRNSTEGDISVGLSSPRGGAKEKRVSFSKGFGRLESDGFNLTLGATLEKRSALAATQRSFADTGMIDFDLNGTPVLFFTGSERSTPGTVVHDNGTPVTPATPDAWMDDYYVSPYFAANGSCPPKHRALDGVCYYDFVKDVEIYPERERAGFTGRFDLALPGDHVFFAEMLAAKTTNTNRIAPTGGELLVGPGSPFWSEVLSVNPAATDPAVVSYRSADFGPRTTADTTEALHLALGLQGQLGAWDYDSAFTHSRNTHAAVLEGGWLRLNAFVNAVDTGLVNPFLPAGQQSAAAMAAAGSLQALGFFEGGRSTLDMLQFKASRELMPLPGGPLALALGASHMRERFDKRASDLAQGIGDTRWGDTAAVIPYSADRRSTAVFAEAVAPVARRLELTGALRHDDYSDFGGNSTAKLAARFQPNEVLLLRASVGTGFRAPSVPQVSAARQAYGVTGGQYSCTAALQQVAASLGAACPVGDANYNVFAGGNPDLKPERSQQWSLGFRLEPARWLSVGADLWQVKLRDAIGSVDEATLFADPLKWRSLFTTYTDPATGQTLLAAMSANGNLGEVIQRGIDLDAQARFATGLGRLTTHLSLTYWLKDRYQIEAGGPFHTSLGRYGPDGFVTFRWRGRLNTTLEHGAFAHTLGIGFRSGYDDQRYTAADFVVFDPVTFQPYDYAGHVRRHVVFDWQTRWQAAKQLVLTAGVLNVFDRAPPRSLKTSGGGHMIGYDDRYYDPRGRTFYANLSYKF